MRRLSVLVFSSTLSLAAFGAIIGTSELAASATPTSAVSPQRIRSGAMTVSPLKRTVAGPDIIKGGPAILTHSPDIHKG